MAPKSGPTKITPIKTEAALRLDVAPNKKSGSTKLESTRIAVDEGEGAPVRDVAPDTAARAALGARAVGTPLGPSVPRESRCGYKEMKPRGQDFCGAARPTFCGRGWSRDPNANIPTEPSAAKSS